ncbi:phage protein [plant metagenome]|uniref:Phage protein n=1 Tax=plant metagenome TaxID=1297885 RepID=A0A484Q6Z3_9ZZZZ
MDLIVAANQSISVTLDGVLWDLTIKAARNTMAADVVRDGVTLVQGQRIVAGFPILPYRYLSLQGNFAILTRDDELPWWEEFGRSQSLVYLTPAEVGIDD